MLFLTGGGIAQLVEYKSEELGVVGSIPTPVTRSLTTE